MGRDGERKGRHERAGKHEREARPERAGLHARAERIDDALTGVVDPAERRLPIVMRLFGLVSLVLGVVVVVLIVLAALMLASYVKNGDLTSQYSSVTIIVFAVDLALMVAYFALSVVIGVRLLLDRRRYAARLLIAQISVLLGIALCEVMLNGFGDNLLPHVVMIVVLVAMESYLDPALSQERRLQRRLRSMEDRAAAEEGTLGLDQTGRGYITLNFFNLFWIFVVCSVIGLAIETVQHMVWVEPGVYQDRAGLLYGPFSPIYGVGAVLMTIALNRVRDRNVVLIFVVSALIGGAFEYFVSWFLQFAFGIVAWDYSDNFLSIGGRTSFSFMCAWGALGLVWIKLLLPWVLRLINKIPWNWRYGVTAVCAVLMAADCAMTLLALDCWYERQAGNDMGDSAIVQYINEHFDDEFMESRFQSMSIDPDNATRAD